MFNYIFKSTSGSFFRTLGRIFAYALIGFLVFMFANYFNILNVSAYSLYGYEVIDFYSISSEYSNLVIYSGYSSGSSGQVNSTVSPTLYQTGGGDSEYFIQIIASSSQTNQYLKFRLHDTNIKNKSFGFYLVSDFVLTSAMTGTSGTACTIYTISDYGVVDSDNYPRSSYSYFIYCPPTTTNWLLLNFYSPVGYGVTVPKYYIYNGFYIFDEVVDNSAIQDSIDSVNDSVNDLNDSITSSDTSGASSTSSSFFDNFDSSDYGLSDIITMPLSIINQLSSATCTALSIPLPFVDYNVTLPCMYDIYQTYFGDFLTLYQTITFGLIAYAVCINILGIVQNLKDPDNDNVEVMEL